MSRTHYAIDKNKGYLEIRVGKKYEMTVPESSVDGMEHKPGIINYSYFYGIPIRTLKVEKNEKGKVEAIHFVFDHHDLMEKHLENKEQLLSLLGDPSHTYEVDEDARDFQYVWIGKRTTILVDERSGDELYQDHLTLTILSK